jgi:dolichol kinase
MLPGFLRGFGILLAYFVSLASIALVVRMTVSLPRELFRKILHMILLGSIFPWLYAFPDWKMSAGATVAFVAIVYPVLVVAEQLPGYSKMLTERKPGELKMSLVLVFGMFAAVISICWGAFGQQYLVLAVILGWGLGDGAAALVGKRFGKHKLEGKLIDGKKSVEGSVAMFAVSFAAIFAVLLFNNALEWQICIPIAVITAIVCAVVELCTKNGMDTVTCPFAATAILLPLVCLWGGRI